MKILLQVLLRKNKKDGARKKQKQKKTRKGEAGVEKNWKEK